MQHTEHTNRRKKILLVQQLLEAKRWLGGHKVLREAWEMRARQERCKTGGRYHKEQWSCRNTRVEQRIFCTRMHKIVCIIMYLLRGRSNFILGEHTPSSSFPSAFICHTVSCVMEYPFGQLGPAVPAVSPLSFSCTCSLLAAGTVWESEKALGL